MFNQKNIQLRQPFPVSGIAFFEYGKIIIEKRGLAVIGNQCLQMLFLPLVSIVDFYFSDFLGETVTNRYREPLPLLRCFDAIAVLPFVFLVLDIVQVTENIGLNHFMDIAEPGKILRLMNCNDHLLSSPGSPVFLGPYF